MTTRAVHDRAERLRADGVPFVHARVVLAERPTSAKPGDEAIVLSDGTIEGFVGGQCAQATVRSQGLAALESGTSVLLRISPVAEPDQTGKTTVHNPCLSGGTLEIFMEPVLPAPRVAIVGDTPIAGALSSVGSALGYEIAQWSLGEMRTTDAVVVATHGFDEEEALVDAVKAGIPYVALVASPKRGRAVLESLDLTDDERARIKSPAGLDIGARTPEEVALSIFAEIIERRSQAAPRPGMRSLMMATAPETAMTAIDPICQMTVAAVESSIHADVDGTTYYFCCPGCRTTFLADPAAYVGS
ncbi:MAG: XdhC family protein [Candidatus Nanopelagicales bacterium]|nr:XdhC family protein [Candidatus Nanopelagicales bacterium]MCF8536905.1 XdhC family protein [Candidatus Nanopelagicales bacterium]MCF8542035.1 XdhC family protein [Candidatus Nanopelagicales bacterium]MCF8556723.1 XdhC family protein [Candidatus Nanopelagicales bacterium]